MEQDTTAVNTSENFRTEVNPSDHPKKRCANGENAEHPGKRQKLLVPSESFANVLRDMQSLDNADKTWTRPVIPPSISDIVFQCTDIVSGSNGSGIMLFGTTQEENSVLVRIKDYMPCFYFPAPIGLIDSDLQPLADYLNRLLAEDEEIKTISIVQKRTSARGKEIPYLKFTVNCKAASMKTVGILENGHCSYKDLFNSPDNAVQHDIDLRCSFISDTSVSCMSWVKLEPGDYDLVEADQKRSRCQLELVASYTKLMLHTPANSSNAPLRILSFDLECFVPDAKKTGRLFSYPRFDPVFQIANMVTRYGEQQPFTRNVFTLNSCDPIDGCQVMSYDNESDMLKQWAKFVKEADPDIIIGYNIARFDLPYLLLRARALGIKEETFFDITKLVDVPIYIEEHKLGQQREWKDAPDVSGRLLFDLLHFTLKYNPGSVSGPGMFRLGPTCERVLGEKKEDVAFTEVNSLQFGDATTRRRLAIYCCKDAYLPQKLLDKTSAFRRYVEDSCKALLPFDATLLLSPGQLSKSSNQIHDITNGILKPTRSYFSF